MAAALLGLALAVGPARAATGTVALPGHVSKRVRRAAKLGRAPANEPVALSLVVRLDDALLDQTLAEIYGGGPGTGRRYLSSAEFARRFDLAGKRQKLKDFARANGLTVSTEADADGSVVVKAAGTSDLVEKAFGVQLNHYRLPGGQVFRAHETDPMIPASLTPHLGAVLGLSNYTGAAHPHVVRAKPGGSGLAVAGAGAAAAPLSLTGTHGVLGGMSPADIKTVYGLNSVAQTGTGQRVAVLELDGYAPSDIALYGTQYGITIPPLTFVGIDGQANTCYWYTDATDQFIANSGEPCNSTALITHFDGGMVEVALDIELVAALAPGLSEIRVYTAANSDQGLYDAYAQIATDNTAKSVTTSWGLDEPDENPALMIAETRAFKQMAIQGQTIYAASGDRGAYDGGGDTALSTDDPASQPYVTGVGGTSLTGTVGSPSESVWNNGYDSTNARYNAGGGGIANFNSTYWPMPGYQSGVPGTASQAFRNVPDVTLNADPVSSPYSICVGGTCNNCSSSCTTLIGGTSAATPLWAGFTALVDQKLASQGNPYLGFANPVYYALGAGTSYSAAFNDITSGNNGGYSAGTGYDNASGWGSFKGAGLFGALTSRLAAVTGLGGAPLGATSLQLTWSAVGGASSYNVYYATDPVILAGTTASTAFTLSGLAANTTMQMLVNSVNAAGLGYGAQSPPISTLAAPISGALTVAHTLTSLSAAYAPCAASPQSASCEGYQLDASVNSNFSAPVFSSATPSRALGTLQIAGLASNTPYYLRVGTLDSLGDLNETSYGQYSTLAQAISGTPVVTPGGASLGATYTVCPAAPQGSSCEGYELDASVNSNFGGTVFSSVTANRQLGTIAVQGLASNTAYFLRLGTLDATGDPTYTFLGEYTTNINLSSPTSPSFSQVSTGTIAFSWLQGANPGGLTYRAQASTASSQGALSGTILSVTGTALSAVFGGLSSDTSYYFSASVVGGPALAVSTQATLAAAPQLSTNTFPAVGATSFTVAWSTAVNEPDTLYQADISPVADFSAGVVSQRARTPFAVFSGLTANTAYFARAAAIGRLGGVTAEVPFGSTTTLVLAPTGPLAFSAQATNGFAFSFVNPGNPAGTRYLVQVSTDPLFGAISASSNTAATTASFAGLLSNQLYYAEVAGLNQIGTATGFISASTATLAGAPLAAAAPVTTFTATGFGFAWTAAAQAPGTTYVAQLSSSPAFAFPVASSATANAFATFAGLQPNTTYYGQVQAASLNPPNPNGPFLAAATGATLPNAPLPAGLAFPLVAITSVTAAWKDLPLAPSSTTAEGYLVQFSAQPDFSTIAASSAVAPGASTATVQGLNYGATYYARVGALGWEGFATYLTLGPVLTLLQPLSSGTVTGAGLSLVMPPAFPALTGVSVFAPPGAFPPGTAMTVTSSVGANLTGAKSNEAGAIMPFGPTVAIDLSAGGLQPAKPVVVTMSYDPTQIPAGYNERQLQFWRLDPVAAQWTLVPSQDDPVGHVLTAYTPHFSTFAPFFTLAGADVSQVQVFPQPWEIGDAQSQYWAGALTFSGLPANATVKIYAITGELVWSGAAGGAGVLTWDGSSRFGRRAASGTYYAAFQNGGQTKIRRLVIIR